MIEINIYFIILINIFLSILITLGTSYFKEIGKNLAISQMKGKLTEIDENIKKQIDQKDRIIETQKNLLVEFHTDCDNLIFEILNLHDDLYYHIFDSEQIPQIKTMVTKLNTSISALNLFFTDTIIIEKAKKLSESLISLSAYRKESTMMYNFFKNLKEEKQNSIVRFNSKAIDRDSESNKRHRESLSSEIQKASERENEIYNESPKKLKGLFELVNKNKLEFEEIVRERILTNT